MKPYTIKCSHHEDYEITIDAPYYIAYGVAKGIAKMDKTKTIIFDKEGEKCDSFGK